MWPRRAPVRSRRHDLHVRRRVPAAAVLPARGRGGGCSGALRRRPSCRRERDGALSSCSCTVYSRVHALYGPVQYLEPSHTPCHTLSVTVVPYMWLSGSKHGSKAAHTLAPHGRSRRHSLARARTYTYARRTIQLWLYIIDPLRPPQRPARLLCNARRPLRHVEYCRLGAETPAPLPPPPIDARRLARFRAYVEHAERSTRALTRSAAAA